MLSEEGVALRGLFVIDKEGVVQHATINNLGFGRSVDETKRVLQVCVCYSPTDGSTAGADGWKMGRVWGSINVFRAGGGLVFASHDPIPSARGIG